MNSSEKLDYLYNSLKRLTDPSEAQEGPALGFQQSPQPEIVYIGECQGHPWYKMLEGGDSGKTPVPFNFLAGFLSEVEIRQKKSADYGDRWKLRLQVYCDKKSFSLVSGLSTYFSRAVVSGLCSLGEDFEFAKSPVGIEVTTGDKGKVILPTLYAHQGHSGWAKVRCDASLLANDNDMTTAINNVLRPRLAAVVAQKN
jgi:hypothetical protein